MRSIVCNPQLVAECNHFRKKMYVIRNLFRYIINPKENAPAVMSYTLRVITYQSFGLDKNKGLLKKSFIFCHSCPKKNWSKKLIFFIVYQNISFTNINKSVLSKNSKGLASISLNPNEVCVFIDGMF